MVLSPKAHLAFGEGVDCPSDTGAEMEVSLELYKWVYTPDVLQQEMGAEPSESLNSPGLHYSVHIHDYLMLCNVVCCHSAEISSW